MNQRLRTWITAVVSAAVIHSLCSAAWVSAPAGVAYAETFVADSAEETMVLGAAVAGIWRTPNGGDLWIPSNASLMPNTYFAPRDVHALDSGGDTVIMRTAVQSASPILFNSEIWWTFDGGLQWTHLPENLVTGNAGDFLAIDPHRHHVWLHLETTSFDRSMTYGQTWEHANLPPRCQEQKSSFVFDPVRDSTIYFTSLYQYGEGQSYGGAWKSEDLGAHWTLLLSLHDLFGLNFADVCGMLRMSNGDLIANLRDTDANWQNGTVLISSDEGVTWERIFAGLPDRFNPCEVIEDCFQPGTVLIRSAEKHGVYRSTDYGHSWNRCANGFPPNVAMTTDLEQNCFSGTIYACIAGYGVYRSTDHGESWQALNSLPPIGSIGYFGMVDSNVFVMNDGFRQWGLDFGSDEWHEFLPPLAQDTLVQMRPISYCSGDTLVTELWKRNRLGPATDHLQVAHSYDRGATWNLQPFLDFLPRWLFSVGKVHDQILFFAFDVNFMKRSTDLGLTWEDASLPDGYWLDRGVVFTDTCLFADGSNYQTNDYEVFRSYDWGDTWEPLNYPGPFTYSANALLTRVGNELVMFSQDTCWAWSNGQWEQQGEVPHPPESAYYQLWWLTVVPYPNGSLLFGLSEYYNQASISVDTGRTWQLRTIELPYSDQTLGFKGLQYSVAQQRLWAIAGIGTCYLPAAELSTDGPLQFKPADYTLLSVYPNPFNNDTKIRFDLLQREHVRITVYDLLGREVTTLTDELHAAGRNELNLNLSDAASGLYFVRLSTPTTHQVQKIVLLK